MIVHMHTENEERGLNLPKGPFCWLCHLKRFKDRLDLLEAALSGLAQPDGVIRGPVTEGPELAELNRVLQMDQP